MKKTISNKLLIKMYSDMVLSRTIEERMLLAIRQGKLSKWFSGIGQEAISIGITNALKDDDTILPMHRNLGIFTSRKIDLDKLFCQLMGKVGGFTKGRDRSFHFGSKEHNIIGMISHLAAMLPVACGIGLGIKNSNQKRVSLALTGDGATSEGDFHESLNLAAVWNLPVIFLIENNEYGLSTPTKEQYACKNLSDRALGYGMTGYQINGNDVEEIYHTIKKCADDCRKGKGPFLIEAMTFRIRGHEEASGVKYVPSSLIKRWKKKDPIKMLEQKLLKEKILIKKDIKLISEKFKSKIENSFNYALNSSYPSSTPDKEIKDVYSDWSNIKKIKPINKKEEMRFVDAISSGLDEKLKSDNKVILLGQDIAEYGGVFKITKGFIEKYGSDRIKNTPIIESGIIGASMGLSIEGYKPVVEMQFADFISCGFNQVVNNLAKTFYRWGEPINVTIRMPSGGGVNAGPFHSQNTEAWFAHTPGLLVVYPSNPYDAKGLLLSSIDNPNPVLFYEHKALYRSTKGFVPTNNYTIELGKAKITRKGSDLTIITYGIAVSWAEEIGAELHKEENINIEIIDLRTLVPLDINTILSSVKKTNRVLVLHEASKFSGFGAEIASIIGERGFNLLDAPIVRLGSLDIPTPFSENLEKNVFWPKNRIKEKVKSILEY